MTPKQTERIRQLREWVADALVDPMTAFTLACATCELVEEPAPGQVTCHGCGGIVAMGAVVKYTSNIPPKLCQCASDLRDARATITRLTRELAEARSWQPIRPRCHGIYRTRNCPADPHQCELLATHAGPCRSADPA